MPETASVAQIGLGIGQTVTVVVITGVVVLVAAAGVVVVVAPVAGVVVPVEVCKNLSLVLAVVVAQVMLTGRVTPVTV